MNRISLVLSLCCIWNIWATSAQAAGASGIDIVAMKNGDIHNGIIARESFVVETPYGRVAVPYAQVAKIRMADEAGKTGVLIMRSGERFSGAMAGEEILMTRVLDPVLPLAFADIDEITFSDREAGVEAASLPDAVDMHNGDRFSARVQNREFMLKTESSLKLIDRQDIRLIDIVVGDEGVFPRAQVTFSGDGDRLQGALAVSSVSMDTRYGEVLEAPAAMISTLVFDVGRQNLAAGFNFRQRLKPESILRDWLRDGSPGPLLTMVAGGEFTRGDLQGDGDSDEAPPRKISLKPFAIGIYEVTFEEYDRFCLATRRPLPDDAEWGRGRRPAVNLSWEDAHAFTVWLGEQTGQRYRLPSDAEWEYAARAGTRSRFWWGDEPGVANANCEGCGSLWDGEMSARVGKFPPNPFGLHDTAGNVFEWVADCFHDTYADAPADGSPLEKPGCGKRVIRGGAWSFPPKEIRSANRWRDFPSRSSDDTGFRVARDLD